MKDDAKRGIAAFCRDAKPGLILIEDDKVVPALDFASEIAIRMAKNKTAGLVTIWSWHSFLSLHVHHQLLELTQTHVHRVSDAIQPSHPLLSLFSS